MPFKDSRNRNILPILQPGVAGPAYEELRALYYSVPVWVGSSRGVEITKHTANSENRQLFKRSVGASQWGPRVRRVGFKILLDFITKWKTES
jgi:hypothetical protein